MGKETEKMLEKEDVFNAGSAGGLVCGMLDRLQTSLVAVSQATEHAS